jgi:tetratricopeptide (TPR) repeat protein
LTLALVAGLPAHAQTHSAQQVYNQAPLAFDKGEWRAAVAGFRRVLAGIPRPNRAKGQIQAPLADALLKSGMAEEARAAAKEAVSILSRGAPAQDDSLVTAYLSLGEAAREELSYPEAIQAFADAQAKATAASGTDIRNAALMGTVLSSSVTDPDLAAKSADALIADTHFFDPLTAKGKATLLALRARVELNRSDARTALPFLCNPAARRER